WIWEQYDHMVMADTLAGGRPGGDAALVRVHGTKKALAITSDATPRYCKADPVEGGKQAVAEAWRNITATGAKPLAITDCMNFGNPEKPEIMGQFVGCIEGMRQACVALDFPVVSGNVSLYNETEGNAVLPTPAIGGVGLIDDFKTAVSTAFKADAETIVLIGETVGHLGQSLYLREIEGREDGSPPPVDLAAERKGGDFVRGLILGGRVTACHDVSDGGILVAIAEMALSGDIGATIQVPEDVTAHAWLFGEDQGRYLVTTTDADALLTAAEKAGVPAMQIGITGGEGLSLIGGEAETALAALRTINEGWLPEFMGGA
ncbi:MAG: phosphoribosylformylglycinamidine synthase II, partial [Rhodospirillales bacterium]|nr:phosphoribosylformylglycinamidine synthase II [Rhodospirillales bacterium]